MSKVRNFVAGGNFGTETGPAMEQDDYADDFELSLDAHGLPSARARDASPEDDILDLAIERELHEQDQVSLLALSLDTPREPEAPAPSSARPPTGLVLADRRGLTPASVPPLQPSASVHLKDSRSLRPSSSIARSIEEPLGQLKTTSKFMTAHHLEGNRDPSPTASRLNTAVAGPSMPPTAARAVTPRGPEPPQPPIILEPDLPSPVPAARSKPPPPARAPSLLTESICDLAMLLNGVAPVDLATLDGHGDAEKPSSAAMSEMESEYERAMGELEGLLHELRAREAVESAVADAPRGRETPGRSAPSSAPEAAPTAASASSESALEAAGAPSTAYVTENLMRIEHHDRAASDPDPEPPSTGESTGSVVEVNLAETDPWLFKPAYEKARKVAEEIAAKRKREQELEETVRKIKELEARIMAQAEDEEAAASSSSQRQGAGGFSPSPAVETIPETEVYPPRPRPAANRVTSRTSYKKLMSVAQAYLSGMTKSSSRKSLSTSNSAISRSNSGRETLNLYSQARGSIGLGGGSSRSSWVS